jgi:hypothetical protein
VRTHDQNSINPERQRYFDTDRSKRADQNAPRNRGGFVGFYLLWGRLGESSVCVGRSPGRAAAVKLE